MNDLQKIIRECEESIESLKFISDQLNVSWSASPFTVNKTTRLKKNIKKLVDKEIDRLKSNLGGWKRKKSE